MGKTVKVKSRYTDYILIVPGTALMALAINVVFEPAGLVTGGFSGLAIIIKSLTEGLMAGGIPLWITTTVLNIPLFLIGFKIRGAQVLGKTLFGAAMLSLWLYIIPEISLTPDDLLLSAAFGGALQGVGIGMVFIGHATTGGTDMVASLIQQKMRHYTVAQIMQVLDALVVLSGAYVFGITKALYAVIAIMVITKVSDTLIEGLHFSKVAYIITEKPEEIAQALMINVDRGVTGITAKGMYTGNSRTMLYCVVGKKQIVALKDIVMELDKDAFVIVTDAREVLGEGFV
ncbi:YitT family protein [Novisyntrophococcus fermenticellae]|uniref:YitT family protein n=1 Tax=Novisyntrophococcus fermenticellae TaxID=2068655 RepID=UPI001E295E19|nr:YitT family protein [Novisyntrophococcus fermenticellae]